MAEDRHDTSPVEHEIARRVETPHPVGRLSESSLQRERSIESYLRSGVMPRYMERLRDIHRQTEQHKRDLAWERDALRAEHPGDPEGFARAWRARVQRWSFAETNELIRTHNEWYPVERQLPMDPRTRDYVLVAGRSYRREELTPEWALRLFPA
ncbi:MAG: hypothetical protein HZB46_06705 [Solirubrobacterales bacterium]|nr:hypothetical protein [Solirubrobacterales bacterium]